MRELHRGPWAYLLSSWLLFFTISLAAPGCGESTDMERAGSGAELKTPDDVLKEARARDGIPEPEKPAKKTTPAKPGAR